jgi:hypothetical protein
MGRSDSLAKRIVYDLGGNWYGNYGTVPGPWHSAADRSVTVRNHQTNTDDACIYSHAGDDVLKRAPRTDASGLTIRVSSMVSFVRLAPRHPFLPLPLAGKASVSFSMPQGRSLARPFKPLSRAISSRSSAFSVFSRAFSSKTCTSNAFSSWPSPDIFPE